jgi:hypothetical protein
MIKNILLAISIISIIVVSCKKNETSIPTSGMVTLSSQLVVDGSSYAGYGLSFTAGAIQKYPEHQVDLMVETSSDTVNGAVFTSPNYLGTFNNTNYNSDLTVAENLFNSYINVTDTAFKELSDTIKTGQIITYKSAANKYAKILVRSINLVNQDGQQYAKVNISWQFQPNGSTKF